MTMLFDMCHLTVCLVEPSRAQGQIIQHHLQELGIERVDRVESGAEALARIHLPPLPDIVISAMYLPDMTGAELVMAMRGDERVREMPFVLVSSETRPQQLDAIRQAGAMAILPKPFTPAQLDKAISSSLDYLNVEDTRNELESLDLYAKKILLVDDSTVSRSFMRSVLERFGFCEITEADNGRSAVGLLAAGNYFDLIITDYNMPEMDGRELIEHIRTSSQLVSVPILMVSGEQDEQRLAAVEEAGVSAICDKPFDIGTLKSLISQFL